MALFLPGMSCACCGKPIQDDDDQLGFTFVGRNADPLLSGINDRVVHTERLSRHPQRDQIVAAWNAATETGLTVDFMLDVSRSGRVRYHRWWGRWKARWRRWRKRAER